MNAYCSVDQLAEALRVTVTTANTPTLTACCEAAAVEVDHSIDSPDPPDYSEPWDAYVNRRNVLRAVQWFKANDAAAGGVGYDQTGALRIPSSTFAPMIPVKVQFGIA